MTTGTERERLISHVIGKAAESLTLEELGRDVLPHFERLMGASKLMLYRSCEQQPFVPVAGAVECLPEYSTRFAGEDPLQQFMQDENPLFFSGTRCRAWADFRANRALAEFHDRWDLSWLFHMRLSDTRHMEPGYAALVCGRAAGRGDFEDADLHAAASVLPALNAAVRRAGRVAAKLSSAAAVEALFERGHSRAVLAFDLQGKLLWISTPAERLLESFLGGGRNLPEPLISAVQRLAALARGLTYSLAGPPPFAFKIRDTAGQAIEAEAYLAQAASGQTFVTVDFGGEGITPNLLELAQRRKLTRTETEVLSDLIRGMPDAEIASRRFVSVATVRTHVTRVINKFGVRSRLQAVAFALGTAPR